MNSEYKKLYEDMQDEIQYTIAGFWDSL
jgi:hypothetical protein